MKKIDVLLVDDHPMIIDSYKQSLLHYSKELNLDLKIREALTLSDAKSKISNFTDIVLLDLQLTPIPEENLFTGEDIATIIRNKGFNTKIVIITMFDDILRLRGIINKINPEGLIIKTDITPKDFKLLLVSILNNNKYYSKTVKSKISRITYEEYELDEIDRNLLYHICKGEKTKDLPEILLLSRSSIERRKRNLKLIFGIDAIGDKQLVEKAIEIGIV